MKKRASPAVVSDVAAFIEQLNPKRARPVKLQFNTSGAWRDVIGFDASHEVSTSQVMAAAEMLAQIAKATCRIVMAGAGQGRSPVMLMRWTPDDGWKAAK